MPSEAPERPYRGPLRAAILDWAGTTVDFGSQAPVAAFVELFERNGVPITVEEARGPMGTHKRDHIRSILAMPGVAERWRDARGAAPEEDDVDSLYEQFVPIQLGCLARHADLVAGALEAVAKLRALGLRIGTCTGYNREMTDLVAREASRRGYEPDCAVTVDDVPAGRPAPWMCLENAKRLGVFPMEACVKVGDTPADVHEGLNAGMWTVAVAATGNEMGLSKAELEKLPEDEQRSRVAAARERLLAAGAHYAVDGIADVPAIVKQLNERLRSGERP